MIADHAVGRALLARAWVAVVLAAAVALLACVLGAAPALAVTPAHDYDTTATAHDPVAYNYDAPARLSSQRAVATDARTSPQGPATASWGTSASTRGCCTAANTAAGTSGGGLLAELKGRLAAARLSGNEAGEIRLGGAAFSEEEIAQLTYQHIGAGDIPGRPNLTEISTALSRAEPVGLEGQNALKYEYGGVRVIVNGDAPWRSTAYYPGR